LRPLKIWAISLTFERIIRGVMTDKEMALEVAQTILQQQMRKIALESILDLYRLHGGQLQWQEKVDQAQEKLLSAQNYRDRIAELRTAFDAANSGDELIRILHNELLYGGKEQA
jgi:hypothetical protein